MTICCHIRFQDNTCIQLRPLISTRMHKKQQLVVHGRVKGPVNSCSIVLGFHDIFTHTFRHYGSEPQIPQKRSHVHICIVKHIEVCAENWQHMSL